MPETDVYADRDAAPEVDVEEVQTETAEDTPDEKDKGNDKSSESATALVPTNFFGGKDLKPGTRCEVEIVKGYEGQVSIKYIPHGTKDSDEDEEVVAEELYD